MELLPCTNTSRFSLKVSHTSSVSPAAVAKDLPRSGNPRCSLFCAGTTAGQLAAMKLFQAK